MISDTLDINALLAKNVEKGKARVAEEQRLAWKRKMSEWRSASVLQEILGLEQSKIKPAEELLYTETTTRAHNEWMSSNIGRRVCGPESERISSNGSIIAERIDAEIDGVKYQVHPGILPLKFMQKVYAGLIQPEDFYEQLVTFQQELSVDDPSHPFLKISLEHLPALAAEDDSFYERWIRQIASKWATANDAYYVQANTALDSLGFDLEEIDEAGFDQIDALQRRIEEIHDFISSKDHLHSAAEIKQELEKKGNEKVLRYLVASHRDWRVMSTNQETKLDNGNDNLMELGLNLEMRIKEWIKTKQKILLNIDSRADHLSIIGVNELLRERESWHYKSGKDGKSGYYFAEQSFAGMLYLLQTFEEILADLNMGKFYTSEHLPVAKTAKLKEAMQALIDQLHYDLAADANASSLSSIRFVSDAAKTNKV